jgi:poly-gamma-glutamate capsule biosynthesis protein CapA/YwtB (metallophosphatase superfamily)
VAITLGMAGDTMLGRGVAEHLLDHPPSSLFSPDVVEAAHEADLFVLNLECCISERGARWPDPTKPFFFRAPPAAVEALSVLGVRCVTLANNHALDFGAEALLDTLAYLASAGIEALGAGPDLEGARAPAVLDANGFRLGVVGLTDHPADYAAGPNRPGVAYADLRAELPVWVEDAIRSTNADAVLVTLHWGPNMSPEPVSHVRRAARAVSGAGATLVAGHSAHVFQGVADRVLFDLGDFIDDYAVDAVLRNDLGLLWLVTMDGAGPIRLEAVPLALDYCHTRVAAGEEWEWIHRRFVDACAAFDTVVEVRNRRLTIQWR